MQFPGNGRFAFSILDDTDDSTLENIRPVYDTLRRHGIRTTKTVWPMDCAEGSRLFFAADTLQRSDYLEFVRGLARDGFEIAFHGATMESSTRERTVEALELIRREFGSYPRLFCNHAHNRENLYWGSRRFQSPGLRWLVKTARRSAGPRFEGDEEGSPYFWGDLCRQHIRYVRNFTFRRLNLLGVNPEMPYGVASTPYVNSWFSTADAPDVDSFKRLIDHRALDELERQGGVCIVSTHLGKGFTRDGRLDPDIEVLLGDLASRPGWFAPVSEILDHLCARSPGGRITSFALLRLEMRFLLDQVRARAGAAPIKG